MQNKDGRYSRQSFLGSNSERIFRTVRVGVIGVGGAGSHLMNLLPHPGFLNFVVVDPDIITESNLNRTVRAGWRDVLERIPKVLIAKRATEEVHRDAKVQTLKKRWQEATAELMNCDIIFSCLDGFSEREQLEVFCRRFLIPLIDVGMDVHHDERDPNPQMSGQVILSMPGHPCMRCLGFLTEEKLKREAAKYGAAGGRPQVIWPNAILAAAAMGIAVDVLTAWAGQPKGARYLCLDGNALTLTEHPRLKYLSPGPCSHFKGEAVGAPRWKSV